jgi:hypothetical protein
MIAGVDTPEREAEKNLVSMGGEMKLGRARGEAGQAVRCTSGHSWLLKLCDSSQAQVHQVDQVSKPALM